MKQMKQHWTAQARWTSPLGPMTLAATSSGLAGAWFDGQKHHPGPLQAPADPRQRFIAQAIAELRDYFDGRRRRFTVALDLHGTPFQRAVWTALLAIPHGATSRYAAIAQDLHAPNASRATGAAVGRNPLSVIVPCHRVLGHDGSLTGYAGGLERKAALLRLEGASMRNAPAATRTPQAPGPAPGSLFTTAGA
jgi:methylated-DNA-[protein]-cysteine S-methyltransferase